MSVVAAPHPLPAKRCAACQVDVSTDPRRVKHGEGDYRCRRCHDAHQARKRWQQRLRHLRTDLAIVGAATGALALLTFVTWSYFRS